MKKKLLIIGFGSAGQRFAKITKKFFKNFEIYIFSKQKNIKFKTINNFSDIQKLNPDFFIICSPTSLHFRYLKKINNMFKNKNILIEKPLFHNYKKLKNIKNKIFVGYNLRILKLINFVKSFLKKNKKSIYDIYFTNHSYLPTWRKNIDYRKSSSAKKKFAGGVILDCAHEIDLANWMLGEISLLSVYKSKKSHLEIETEDNCKIFAKHNNINLLIDLNYYSNCKKREILILGKNYKLNADLIKSKVTFFINKKSFTKKFDNQEIKKSYLLELRYFLSKKNKNLASYNSALLTQKLLQKIKN